MNKPIFAVLTMLAANGCTSITVQPLAAAHKVEKICVKENPRVMVEEMIPIIEQSLAKHKIQCEVIPSNINKTTAQDSDNENDRYWMDITPTPDHCDFTMTYSARQTWDLGTYLSTADFVISNKTSAIASANYHLRNKGGLSLLKWQAADTKLMPVLDELFKFY